jgi:hypothetical protein
MRRNIISKKLQLPRINSNRKKIGSWSSMLELSIKFYKPK